MKRCDADMLGLFPSLAADTVGGVQASGRIAWEGVTQDPGRGHARLFTTADLRRLGTGAKLRAAAEAMRTRWSARVVLVWHLALLKLLPFFRISDGRVVVFLHGIEAWRRPDWRTRTLLRRVDLFLSNSDYTWERFVAFNPAVAGTTHRTVHLGVGEPVAGPSPPPEKPVALMVGRLLRAEDYKGHRELIAAWPVVQARIPDAELWIAGDGDLRGSLERAARRSAPGGRIRFWGQVTEPEKERLLVGARCLALPSRGEGFGLVYLEAMRVGRPCLVSSVDAGREVVAPPIAGVAADPRSPAALADAVCRLLTPSAEWTRWSDAARRRYEAQFTARHFQQRLLGALAEVEAPVLVGRA